MSDKIKLVSGDNRPYITLTLTDADGSTINLSGATVVVFFRATGTTAVLATIPCTLVSGGTTGKVSFNFPGTTLNVPAGLYEGEVSITFGASDVQTIYDTLKFQVREQFA
jgi:hypothetical protein